MQIREASLSDAAGIARVHVDSWRSAYREIVPRDILDGLSYEQKECQWEEAIHKTTHQEFVYVAEDEASQIIGFASGGPALNKTLPSTEENYLRFIFLMPISIRGLDIASFFR